jgi:hypothetical protein
LHRRKQVRSDGVYQGDKYVNPDTMEAYKVQEGEEDIHVHMVNKVQQGM